MKNWMAALVMVMLPVHTSLSGELHEKVWNRGSEDCSNNRDPAIEVFQFDAATYILRQNKCVHFEAPFIYVLFGEHTVRRLVEFSKTHRISAVMGTHVEMSSTPGKVYPRGSTFQPDEIGLALTVEDLLYLDERLRQAGAKPQKIAMAKFVVTPVGAFQRVLGSILKWIGVR